MATDTLIKTTELTELTTGLTTDVLPIVSDPGGTPVTKKITVKSLLEAPVLYSIVPAANFSLGTGTSVQSAFPTTGDVFTLEGATTYLFEGMYFIDKSGTTCTTGMAFALGGSASITSIKYVAIAQNVAKNTTGATHGSVWVDRVAATVVNATATTAVYIKFNGIIRMNVAGTVTPQIIFSAAPTSPVMVADSYIKFTKVGTNVENTVGSVA
jgi:hypothetical protein